MMTECSAMTKPRSAIVVVVVVVVRVFIGFDSTRVRENK